MAELTPNQCLAAPRGQTAKVTTSPEAENGGRCFRRRRRRSSCHRSSRTTFAAAVYYGTSAICLCATIFRSHSSLAFSPISTTTSIYHTSSSILPLKNNRRHAAAAAAAAVPQSRCSTTQLYNNLDNDDDDDDDEFESGKYDPAVAAQIRKAKRMVKDAKMKQKARDDAAAAKSTLPFFAATQSLASSSSSSSSSGDNSKKIKSKTETGEIIADGETMASLSKSEPWELRSLSQMAFQREAREDYDGNVVEVDDEIDGSVLADRDLARSIYGLRKVLQTEDFVKVFDKGNFFIGEVE